MRDGELVIYVRILEGEHGDEEIVVQDAVVHLVRDAAGARHVIPAFRLVTQLLGDRLNDVIEHVIGVGPDVGPRRPDGRDDEASLLGRHGPALERQSWRVWIP
jgi:hypothetical protein